jgi:single-stranded-DNA-specific exonuclease
LLKSSCTDPSQPDSRDVAFSVAPRINAAGRMAHPAEALAVFEAARDEEAARQRVDRLNQLNMERRRTVKLHFEELVEAVGTNIPAGLVVYRETSPKGIAGLLASKCVERYSVPSIVLVPSTIPGQVVGSGRSIPGVDLVKTLEPLEDLFLRFGGHAQAVGLTMGVDRIEQFREKFAGLLDRWCEEAAKGCMRKQISPYHLSTATSSTRSFCLNRSEKEIVPQCSPYAWPKS